MSGLDNIFEFLKTQCEDAAKGFEEAGGLRPFAKPAGDAEDFLEESLDTLFDRKEEEEQYVKAVDGETEKMHKEMMVPSLKNDFIATWHRDTFLRTHPGNRIKRFIAEASRRKNQAENVHEEKKKMYTSYETLEAKEDA